MIKSIVNINDVKIKENFKRTTPKQYKLDRAIASLENGVQMKPVVLDNYGYLIDGYATYLALKQLGIEKVWCESMEIIKTYKDKSTYYVFGIHHKGGKEYVWRIPNNRVDDFISEILPGDKVLVGTKNGVKKIIVTKIQLLDKSPTGTPVKKVIRKLK